MSQTLDPKVVRRWRRDVYRAFTAGGLKPAEISAAMVLVGAALVGTDTTVLSQLTGLSADYALKIVRRLRKQRVIRGKTIRAAWASEEAGDLAVILDAGTAAGIFSRFADKKRSAAQKARAPETRARGPRPRATSARSVGPLVLKKSNPLYGLPEWETGKS